VFKPESDPEKQLEKLPEWLAMASAWAQHCKTELLIVLDGLDKISERQHLRWFPAFLPPRVKLIASCLDGDILEAAKGRLHWQELKVKPFTKTEQKGFIGEYLGRYRKSLTAKQYNVLQSHPLSGNPLFLLTVLEELRVFGVHEQLEQRLNELLSPPPSKLKGEAPSVDDVFEHVLSRLEKDIGKKSVQLAMESIWASRSGLLQDELLAIAKLTPAKWAIIHNALDDSLYESSGKINFGHDYFHKAVEDRYVFTRKEKARAHRRLSRYFIMQRNYIDREHSTPNIRKSAELPFQYFEAGDSVQLLKCLTDFNMLMAACHAGLFPIIFSDYIKSTQIFSSAQKKLFFPWLNFLQYNAHVLFRADADWTANRILLQLAWENGKDNPVGRAAAEWISSGYCDWPRIMVTEQPLNCPVKVGLKRLESSSETINHIAELKNNKLLGWTEKKCIEWDLITGCITKVWNEKNKSNPKQINLVKFALNEKNYSIEDISFLISEHEIAQVSKIRIIDDQKAVAITDNKKLLLWDIKSQQVIFKIDLSSINVSELLACTKNWILIGERQYYDTDQGYDTKSRLVLAFEIGKKSLYEVAKLPHTNTLQIYDRGNSGFYIIYRDQVLFFDPVLNSPVNINKDPRVFNIQYAIENHISRGEWLIIGANRSMIWNVKKAKSTSSIATAGNYLFGGCGDFSGNRVVIWDLDYDLEEGSFGNVHWYVKNASNIWEKVYDCSLLAEVDFFDSFSSYQIILNNDNITISQNRAFWIFCPSHGTIAKYLDECINGTIWRIDDSFLLKVNATADDSSSQSELVIQINDKNNNSQLHIKKAFLSELGYQLEYEPINGLPIIKNSIGNSRIPFSSSVYYPNCSPVLPIIESSVSHDFQKSSNLAIFSKSNCYVSICRNGSESRWYGSGNSVNFVRHRNSLKDDHFYTPNIGNTFFFIEDSEQGFMQLKFF
jgi:hypothetical protein